MNKPLGLLPRAHQFMAFTLLGIFALSGCASKPKSVYLVTTDRESIRKVVVSHIREVVRCYEKALDETPMLGGKLVLHWTFDDTGKVVDVVTKSADPSIAPVAPCVVAEVRTWTFPPAAADSFVEVAYPFFFSENGNFPAVKKEEPSIEGK